MGVASGKSFGRLYADCIKKDVRKIADKQGKAIIKYGKSHTLIAITDPVLQRRLSRLQLLDTLAMQVDRHGGDCCIQFDENGKVIGAKGIDNDMAFEDPARS